MGLKRSIYLDGGIVEQRRLRAWNSHEDKDLDLRWCRSSGKLAVSYCLCLSTWSRD